MQKQYVEKPTKVLAEQYLAAASPPAAGVHFCNLTIPWLPTGGPPHCHIGSTIVMVQETDWVLMSPHHPGVVTEVLTATEFSDRFGEQGPPS